MPCLPLPGFRLRLVTFLWLYLELHTLPLPEVHVLIGYKGGHSLGCLGNHSSNVTLHIAPFPVKLQTHEWQEW